MYAYAGELKEKIHQRVPTIGTLMNVDFWPGYLEMFKNAGLDFVMLDMEHSSASLQMAEELCRTARLVEMPLILRPVEAEYHIVRRCADMGPTGFMIPAIESVKQVDAVQDAIFFAPKGRRRPGGPSSYAVPSLDRAGWEAFEQNFCVFLQVETLAGIDTMKTTMARDWVDAVVLGPYDLAIDMDLVNERFHPELVGAITQVIENAHEIGKPCGMPSVSLEEVKFWWERGCTLFLYSAPEGMVQTHITEFMVDVEQLSCCASVCARRRANESRYTEDYGL